MAKVAATTVRDLIQFMPLRESSAGSLRAQTGPKGRSVFKGVTIIKSGLGNHRDKNFYPAETLETAVKGGYFDGLRAYADHQDALSEEVQPERTVRDMVGVYMRPRFVRESREKGRVVADLHLFRSSKWLSETIDDLIDLGQADKIGLSINGRGRTVERQVQLEEAADPINVNWVEDFVVLRSADVVTEAGAGGGFQQLLESARGSAKVKEKDMKRLTEQQKKDIKAAVDANDTDKLTELLRECGCMDAAAAAAPAKGKKASKTTEAEEPEETEDAEGDEAEEQDTTEAELEAEAERIKAEADGPDDLDTDDVSEGDGEDDDPEGEDAPDEELAENDEEDDEEASDTREAGPYRGSGMPKGAGVLIKGKGGKHAKTIKGDKATKGSFTKPSRQRAGLQKGRRYAEADAPDLAAIRRQNEKLREENARLATQLRVRTTTDRARNLLRESAIPGKLQPEILRHLVGKSEDEMRRVIRYHERLIESAIEERDGYVEGAGSRFRESYHGGARDDMASVLNEVGIPLRGK